MKSSPPKMIAKRHENTLPEKVVFKKNAHSRYLEKIKPVPYPNVTKTTQNPIYPILQV
jgi:hypothetical protein